MQATYGSKWNAQYPTDMLELTQQQWLRVLSKITLGDIKRGLENWNEDWPPNVFEFEKACRPPPPGVAGILADERQKKLPQRVSKEKAMENLDNLRNIIDDAKTINRGDH